MRDASFFREFADLLQSPNAQPSPAVFADMGPTTEAAIRIYRNNVRASLSKALGETFPVVFDLVGEAFFKFAANEYFNAAAPTSRLLSDYGNQFPEFLDAFEPAKQTPYLGDVARLELAWLSAYRAEDKACLNADQLMAVGDENLEALRVQFHPAVQILESPYPIGSIWRKHKDQSDDAKISVGTGECVLVSRPERNVAVDIISRGNFVVLQRLHSGANIADAFAAALAADDVFDPQSVFQIIFAAGVTSATAD